MTLVEAVNEYIAGTKRSCVRLGYMSLRTDALDPQPIIDVGPVKQLHLLKKEGVDSAIGLCIVLPRQPFFHDTE